jgi:dTDP-4-dehydrorhamnose 3,5-epimerase
LSDTNHRQLWIPPGYAHGFVVVSDIADFEYKCTAYYHPQSEIGVIWNDPDLDIVWPIEDPMLSDKDKRLPTLAELASTA